MKRTTSVSNQKGKTPWSSWISEPGASEGLCGPDAARWLPWRLTLAWTNNNNKKKSVYSCLIITIARRDKEKGGKNKKIILAIFSFFQDNLCVFRGLNRKWASRSNVYLPLLFLLLLRPWYSHCLKGTFCVKWFDEKWFFAL